MCLPVGNFVTALGRLCEQTFGVRINLPILKGPFGGHQPGPLIPFFLINGSPDFLFTSILLCLPEIRKTAESNAGQNIQLPGIWLSQLDTILMIKTQDNSCPGYGTARPVKGSGIAGWVP